MEKVIKINLVILYILIIILFIFSFKGGITGESILEKNEWRCTNVVCSEFYTAQEWIQENCFLTQDQQVCKINVNGINQLVPIENIDFTVFKPCKKVICSEEVKVRKANYPLNISQ